MREQLQQEEIDVANTEKLINDSKNKNAFQDAEMLKKNNMIASQKEWVTKQTTSINNGLAAMKNKYDTQEKNVIMAENALRQKHEAEEAKRVADLSTSIADKLATQKAYHIVEQ